MTDTPETAITPGPWKIVDNRILNDAFWIEAHHPEGFSVSIAEVRQGCDEADEIGSSHANARLIAAAPDLLAACKLAVAAMGPIDAARHIQQVIDRAEGKL